jgi:hypothetical protein
MLFMPVLRLALITSTLLASSLATAQTTTYQWIDPKTGTTVISDQQPPPGVKLVTKRVAEESSGQEIPYATRQAAEKFPVVLYTGTNCTDGCKQGRDLLNNRGVPFSEKELKTQEDIIDLGKLTGGEAAIPSLIVGRQNFKGYEAGAWNNLLDLAGYPKSAPFGTKATGALAK